jgi:hypothetical protein
MSTAYHARYFAYELTRKRPAADVDRLSISLFNASVDLKSAPNRCSDVRLEVPVEQGRDFGRRGWPGKNH